MHVPAVMMSRLQLKVPGRDVYLEQAAIEHSDDQQHLFIRHVSSGHLEGQGWDVNPVIRYRFFGLQKQEYVRPGKQIHSEYHVDVYKIWSHCL